MKTNYNKYFKIILIITILIILFASLEALINAKSIESFEAYKTVFPNNTSQDYINFVLLNYFFNILEPAIISLFLFLTYNKLKPNKLYAIVFGGMMLIKLVNMIFTFNLYSIFYYILLILYILLLVFIIKYCNDREVWKWDTQKH